MKLRTVAPGTEAPPGDSPTTAEQRFGLLDSLRGFALFGVLMVNLVSLSLFEFLTDEARAALPTAAWDTAIEIVMAALVDGKFITLFTLLFGIGFAMQSQRASGQAKGMRRYAGRMLILLAIGLTHGYLFWWGDILRYYAVCGLLLMALTRLSSAALAGLGIFVAVLLPALLQPVLPALLPSVISSADSARAALQAFSSDSLGVALAGNLARDLRMRIAVWFLPMYVLGRILIGVAIGKSGLLQNAAQHRRSWLRILLTSGSIGIGATAFFLLRRHGIIVSPEWLRSDPGRFLLRLLWQASSLSLGLAYMAGIALLYQAPFWRRGLAALAPMGRMALSHYLAQTLIGIVLFYGIGLGIGPNLGLVGVVLISVLVFTMQVLISHWWLSRYRFGPVEWLWRSLSYGARQTMRRERPFTAP
ncbi:MAG: DUF418 domain-containing protein [Pseudomonadota bacterium]|nr:DUF418 domain-containing protein [Pseudomonadota bacterium]